MSIGNHIHKFIDFEIRGGDSSFIHLKLVFTYGLRFVCGGFFRNDISFLWGGEKKWRFAHIDKEFYLYWRIATSSPTCMT